MIGAAALLDHAMARAAAAGGKVDALRMVAGKIAANVNRQLAGLEAGRRCADAAELFVAAFEATLAKTRLPEERQQAVRDAFSALLPELEDLPLVRSAAFFDTPEAAAAGSGELFSLALDPDACKGCGLCVTECEPAALITAADAPRRNREARRAVAPRRGRCRHRRRRRWSGRSRSSAPLAGTLLAPAARTVLTAGDADEAGGGESLAARLVLGTAAAALAPRRTALLSRLDAVADELGQAIQGALAKALPGRDLDALSRGLAGMDRPEADLAALAARVETAFEGDRVDVPRLRHLVDAARELADLRWHLTGGSAASGDTPQTGRALFSVVAGPGAAAAWAGTFPAAPFTVPVTVSTSGDAAALARGVLAGQTAQAIELLRALRRARVELDAGTGPAAEQRVEEELSRLAQLSWRDLDAAERALVPPLFWVASEDAALTSSLPGLLGLLGEDQPVKVLLLGEAHLGVAEQGANGGATFPSFDAGLLALVPPRAFVAQSSIAYGDHLATAVRSALDHDGPALLRVHAPSPQRHGFATAATVVRARTAVEARVHPLWSAVPAAMPGAKRRLDLAGNPAQATASVAEWALGERRFAACFTPLGDKDGQPLALADYRALEPEERAGKVAFVEVEKGRRLRVSDALLAAEAARLGSWEALRERATGDEAEPATATAGEVAATERAHQAELAALRADYEDRLAATEGAVQADLAQKVRRRLMALALRQAPTTTPLPPVAPVSPANGVEVPR